MTRKVSTERRAGCLPVGGLGMSWGHGISAGGQKEDILVKESPEDLWGCLALPSVC